MRRAGFWLRCAAAVAAAGEAGKVGKATTAASEGEGVRGGGAGEVWGEGEEEEEEAELTVLVLAFQLPGSTALRGSQWDDCTRRMRVHTWTSASGWPWLCLDADDEG